MEATKTCTKCKQEKISIFFSKDKSKKDGLSSHCKNCVCEYKAKNKQRAAEYDKKYRKDNKESIYLRSLEYYKENKEGINLKKKKHRALKAAHISEYNKSYYNKNSATISDKKRIYRETNRNEYLLKTRVYQQSPNGKAAAQNAQHRRRSQKNKGDATTQQLLNLRQTATHCYWCGCRLTKNMKIQIDHYVPLGKGGEHTLSNLVVSCAKCNQSKNAKDPLVFANAMERLL
jgi:5-methylcytosine-specific restriction endonuclease McrA